MQFKTFVQNQNIYSNKSVDCHSPNDRYRIDGAEYSDHLTM